MRCGKLAAADCVKVDGSPCNNVLPLGVWKFRAIRFVDEGSFSCFGIDCVYFDEFESFGEGVS